MDVTGGMRRLTSLASSVDAENGRRMPAMMKPSLESLEVAADHADRGRFGEALEQSVSTCNACHATGSGFVRGSLDVPVKLSLRHLQVLRHRAAPAGHTQQMPSAHEAGGHGHHEAVEDARHGGEEG